jgi:TRAP-type C4-dicarboxylate transport system permease small subunit
MALLTCADVIGRLFKYPIFGSIELVSFMGVLTVAMALPITQLTKGHIGVELFVNKLPRKGRLFIELCTEIVSLVLFVVIILAHVPVQQQAQGLGGGVDEPALCPNMPSSSSWRSPVSFCAWS